MESDSKPAKRPRTEQAPETTIQKSTKFWFEDGNIILQAEETQFRVHRSMLARHSVVWKDMFDIPQPPGDLKGECPVVYLSDAAADVDHIMTIFYDNLKIIDKDFILPFSLLAAMLRLGRKYEIGYLQDRAMSIIREEHPTNLSDWGEYLNSKQVSKISGGSPTDLINLAHEFGLKTTLPVAYFRYTRSTPLASILSDATLHPDARTPCILGRDRLTRWVHSNYDSKKNEFGSTVIRPDCQNITRCGPDRQNIFNAFNVWEAGDGHFTSFDSWAKPKGQGTCTPCYKALRSCHDKVSLAGWDLLPGFFSLPDWTDLKDFDL